jgi:UDP-glucose 4-epimerase
MLLVTGGAGFIGSNLCRLALESGVGPVRVLDDLSTGSAANLAGLEVEFIPGSILNPAALLAACAGVEAIVHLAAVPSVPRSIVDPWTSHEANATGTVRLLEAARKYGVGQVVVASSSSVYGARSQAPRTEDAVTRPLSPYAASKLATEAYALAYQSSYGLAVLAVRLFNVYGPGQAADHPYAAVIPRFLDAALAGAPVEIYGDGRQTRDFTFVESVTRVLLDAVVRRVAAPDPVNLAFGTSTSVLDLVDTLRVVLDRPIEVRHGPARVGEVAHSRADSTRLRELFPAASATPLVDGLAQTAAWFRAARPASSAAWFRARPDPASPDIAVKSGNAD